MKYTAVVLAAGHGTRMGLGYNKVLYKLNDDTVIENTLDIFVKDKDCIQIVLVVGDLEYQEFLNLGLHYKVEFAIGGARRQDSVLNGLKRVTSDYVMIHDGARPFLNKQSLERLKDELENYECCLLAVPSTDTIKVVHDGYVVDTPKRETLYQAQTPQAFKTTLILDSYQDIDNQNINVTDDAEAVELSKGIKSKVVLGDYQNIKLTTPKDIK